MRFKDEQVIDSVAKAVLAILELPLSLERMPGYRKKVLTCMCRELENFLILRKSVAAQTEANRLGIEDLAKLKYSDRTKTTMGGKASIFYFEHVVTVSSMVEALSELSPPSIESVKAIIAKADVAWITKAENSTLNRMSARSRRVDPLRTYKEAGIDLCPD